MHRRAFQLLLAVLVAALPLVTAVAPAGADNASTLLGLVNSLRRLHGAAPLAVDPTLTANAQQWSAHMAAAGALSHNPNYGAGVAPSWTKLGENVGEGGALTAIYNAFVASPFHFGNMIDPSYNLTGIAVATGAGNSLWITQDFESRSSGTPATTAPPATTATTRAPTITRPPSAPPPTHSPAPTTAPPATAAPTTAPPTTAGPTTTSVVAVPGSSLGSGSDSPATSVVPLGGGDPEGPGRLAAAASFSPHQSVGDTLLLWLLTLSGLAVLSTTGAWYFVKKPR